MTDSRRIDAASRRAIREDLLANLLVEAGAGSGKTQMLAARMAAGVAEGLYQIERMAAVTFTRKAASELRGRFHLALEHELRGPDVQGGVDADARSRRVHAALGNLERFFAGTIHSFCARLLRERPVESGVSPGFTELDEVQDLELRTRTWREYITAARSAGDPLMLEFLDTGVRSGDLDEACRVICENEDVAFPPGDGECPEIEPAWKGLRTFWGALEAHLPLPIHDDTTCPIQKAAREYKAQARVAPRKADRPATLAALLRTWNCTSKITQNRWGATAAEKKWFKDLIEPLHAEFKASTVEPFLAQWRQYVYRLAVTLLTRAREHAAAERRRLNTLNYGDLLNLSARVLRGNAQVRRALQRKYQFLFVDEFQDTDPVQAEIVFLLAADDDRVRVGAAATATRSPLSSPDRRIPDSGSRTPGAGPRAPAADWRRVPLRPGALFVVGDPKQSIYRFRRADIEIYNAVRARFSEPDTGRVLPLTMNYRSAQTLCDWANEVFEKQFPAEATAQSPRYAPLDATEGDGARTRAGATPVSGIFTLTHSCESGEVVEQDAGRIARYIRAEVAAGRRKYSDFLILTRKKKDRIAPYAAALEALDVPIEVSGAGAFGGSAEVEALTALLRALADPQDPLALVAVLRGPLFGVSDPELYAYKQAGGWFSLFASRPNGDGPSSAPPTAAEVARIPEAGCRVPNSASLVPDPRYRTPGSSIPDPGSRTPDPVAAALAALHRYYRWTRILPAAGALERVLEDTGYLALAATSPGGVEAGDLLHAVDRVRQVVEEGGSLADAADALEADAEASSEVESLPLEPGRSDVVRVMNLHKAKGLEAAVVFLADPWGGVKPWVDVRIAREGEVAQGWFRLVKKPEDSYAVTLLGEHADWPLHEATELPFVQAEEKRLLYVAATRARDMLVVSRAATVGGKSTPAWGVLNDFLGAARELPVPADVSEARPAVPDCSSAEQEQSAAAIAAAHFRVRQPSWSITSVTAEARHIASLARTAEPAAADDVTSVVVPDTPSHRADAGMAWGTLIHGLLEHAMRFPSATRDDLRRMAMWLTVEEPQLRVVLEEALDTVASVAQSPFWREAQGAEHYVEAPFTVVESAGALVNGVVDLLHLRKAGWAIVDYKSDLDDATGSATYLNQLERYRKALSLCSVAVLAAEIQPTRRQPPE